MFPIITRILDIKFESEMGVKYFHNLTKYRVRTN
jgi:hypothetical protein